MLIIVKIANRKLKSRRIQYRDQKKVLQINEPNFKRT